MSAKNQNQRIILGLKVKHFRQQRGLSFHDLARRTGISVSYLNEIEKGKKYPKTDKIAALAEALEVKESELTSPELSKNLAPLSDLLNSNFLNELPLDLFGIELPKVVEIIANSPAKVGAFISTLVELSRNYALAEENFYFGSLRSYLELHNNYFEDLEQAVERFVHRFRLQSQARIPVGQLAHILEKHYGYTIVEDGLAPYPELRDLRSVFIPSTRQLLLNGELTENQRAFQLGKELGFNFLGLEQRANTSSLLRVHSFEEVLSHFKANYFSAALLLPRMDFLQDLEQFFRLPHWDGEFVLGLLEKYQASPEMLLQRMSNLLPKYFGLEKLFILRFVHQPDGAESFRMDKELHLNRRHHPHGNGLLEHYCRRWLAISLLKDLNQMQSEGKYVGTIVGAQRSRYYGTDDEYFCITLARPAAPGTRKTVSITIGILVDEDLRRRLHFLDDPAIQQREVNKTCERCPIQDCSERAAPPTVVQARNRRKAIQKALNRLLNGQA